MQILIQNINYYHSNQGNASRFKTVSLNPIDITSMVIQSSQAAPVNVIQMLASTPLFFNNINIFYNIRMGLNYLPNVNKYNLDDACRNCIKNNAGD